jgi:GNAT superfamily N-acetyltransferase
VIERAKADEQHFFEALEMVAKLHRQGAMAPLNADKMAVAVFSVLDAGMMIFARDAAGRPIGMLPLAVEAYFYSDETFIHNLGLWIEPEWRATGVLRALLKEAKEEAIKRDTIGFITITDPDRRKKPAPEEAQILGYVSVGYTFKLQGKRHG